MSGRIVNGHILVADDDGGVRSLLSHVLTSAGYTVSAVANGRDALGEVRRLRPQLILMNLWMPVMDGRQFAARYREEAAPHAPFVLISGAVDVSDAAAETGAADYLEKPFDVEHLLARIELLISPPHPRAKGGDASGGRSVSTAPRVDERRRLLRRLAATVEGLRAELHAVNEETTLLLASERQRHLTEAEARRISALRMESERLRLELVQCRREFEALN